MRTLEARYFLNQSATENSFRDNAAEAAILHLSMHARVDDLNPNSSAFYFAGTEVSTGEENYGNDNILHLYELYNMPLKANLVVLSACETGIGRYARGEGIMSLGRAFQFAGCPSVTMSLWSVNDRSSAGIMENFFFNLSEGMRKDEALRQAKLSFIKDPQNKYFAHPYYWSGFTLMGDPTPVVEKHYPTYTFLIIALLALVLIATMAFRRYRRA
ncbi:tetratricopeptide repeat domain protein [Fulvivirga imtechensis AK7]|uniref:Tetratricopeptide repeat domain protein n=2 Tax=Fulvivirga TaxID=396811 RepID=L8JPN7_9BACT|nr:tetratricopeptide repeat domain protein [Fulvivirga imtechensis AK7]